MRTLVSGQLSGNLIVEPVCREFVGQMLSYLAVTPVRNHHGVLSCCGAAGIAAGSQYSLHQGGTHSVHTSSMHIVRVITYWLAGQGL